MTTPDDKPIPSKADKSVKATITYGKRWVSHSDNEQIKPTDKVLTLSDDGTTNLVISPPINTTNINIHVTHFFE